jgi:hypothetical protein
VYWRDEVSAKRHVKAMGLERPHENVGAEVVMQHGTQVTWGSLAGGLCVGREGVLAVKPEPATVLLFAEKTDLRKTGEQRTFHQRGW